MDVMLEIKNNQSVQRDLIPVVDFEQFKKSVIAQDLRVVNLYGLRFDDRVRLYAILADDANKKLFVTSCYVGENYPCFTVDKPSLQLFERLIYEEVGVEPIGHPFLKPVRKMGGYEFVASSDLQTHEVAVGPVHAGIIEPGHFRFICNGERVNHLEIQLGYQHRGVEKLLKRRPTVQLAESICGDSTIGHSLAFARAIEGLSGINVDERQRIIRLIALEMERIAIHVGDIGAIAGDVGYYMAADVLAVTRTLVINAMLELCGSRFGKGLMRVGGVNYDIDDEIRIKILRMLHEVGERTDKMVKAMFAHATVLSRFENTGIVSKKRAKEIGMVGLVARASGVESDCRIFDDYERFGHKLEVLKSGDVYARAYLRYMEIKSSTELIRNMLEALKGDFTSVRHSLDLSANSFVCSLVEGWRGEISHCIFTDANSCIEDYKIKDPSFHNWLGLAVAVRNNQISDFPVCNKSFDLSYCGFDL